MLWCHTYRIVTVNPIGLDKKPILQNWLYPPETLRKSSRFSDFRKSSRRKFVRQLQTRTQEGISANCKKSLTGRRMNMSYKKSRGEIKIVIARDIKVNELMLDVECPVARRR